MQDSQQQDFHNQEGYLSQQHQDLIDEEGWTNSEKLSFVSKVFYVSIFLILSSVGLAVLGFKLYSAFKSLPYLLLISLSILLFIYSLITAYWSRTALNELSVDSGIDYANSDNNLRRLIFSFGSILLVFVLIYTYFAVLYKNEAKDYIKATQTPSTDADVLKKQAADLITIDQQFQMFLNITICVNTIIFICLFFIVFVSYQFCNHINGLRLFIYITGVLVSLYLIAISYQVQLIQNLPKTLGAPSDQISQLVLPIAFINLALVGTLFLFNYTKSRYGYLAIGCVMILLVLIQTIIAGHLIRTASTWKPQNEQLALMNVQDEKIQARGCSAKYYGVGTTPLPCSPTFQVRPWESSTAQVSCLNTNCDGLANNFFANYIRELGFNMLLCSSLTFLLAASAMHLSNRYAGEKNLNVLTERIMLFIFVVCLTAGLLCLIFKPFKPVYQPQLDQTSVLLTYPTINEKNCLTVQSILNHEFTFELNKDICPDKDCTNIGLIVAVQGGNGTFNIPEEVSNDEGIWYFQNSISDNVFPTSTESTTSLLVQGFVDNLSTFFNSLQFCSTNPSQQLVITTQQADLNYLLPSDSKDSKDKKDEDGNRALQSSTFSDAELLTGNEFLDQQIKFSNLTLTVVDLENDKLSSEVYVKLYQGKLLCQEQDKNLPFSIQKTSAGLATFYNLISGYDYTVIIEQCKECQQSNYASACQWVSGTETDQTVSIGLVNKLDQPFTLKYVLQWDGDIDVGLYATATSSDKKQTCIQGGMNLGCPGMSTSSKKNVQIATITTLQQFQYLFYAQQSIGQDELAKYQAKLKSDNVAINSEFLGCEGTIMVYVHERDFPVVISTQPVAMPYAVQPVAVTSSTLVQPNNAPVQGIDTPIWLSSCLDGSVSDVVQVIDQYWVNTNLPSGAPQLLRNSITPSSDLCDYF